MFPGFFVSGVEFVVAGVSLWLVCCFVLLRIVWFSDFLWVCFWGLVRPGFCCRFSSTLVWGFRFVAYDGVYGYSGCGEVGCG